MSYLVDTNVFSELAKTKPDADVVAWLRDHETELYLSTITIGELRRGIEKLPAGKRKTALQAWFTGLCGRMEGRILSFNTSTAHVWGQLMAAWDKKGTSIEWHCFKRKIGEQEGKESRPSKRQRNPSTRPLSDEASAKSSRL